MSNIEDRFNYVSEQFDLFQLIVPRITDSLRDRMQKWLEENPDEIYWNYDDELSSDQVDKILEGEAWEVMDDIYEWHIEHVLDLQNEKLVECFDEFAEEILAGLEFTEDDLDNDVKQDILREYDLMGCVDLDLEGLAGNGQYRLTLDSGIGHEYMPMQSYETAEEILKFFNVNPRRAWEIANGSVDSWLLDEQDKEPWPDMPERNGNEYIKPAKLIESLYNMSYSGEFVFLLMARSDIIKIGHTLNNNKSDEIEVIVPEKTRVVPHNYLVGSSGLPVKTQREMRIKLTSPNQLCRDGRFKYGVDDVFGGLFTHEWDSEVKLHVIERENTSE